MKAVAFIPARAGSTRLPGKNMLEVGGVSLVRRAVDCALDAGIAHVVVSTDSRGVADELIASTATPRGERSYELNMVPTVPDRSDLRAEMWAWWEKLADKPDALMLLNPTSPLRTAEHVREALALLERTGADIVVGVCEGHEPHFAGTLMPQARIDYARPRSIPGDAGPYWMPPPEPGDKHARWFDWQPSRAAGPRPRTQDLPRMGWENGAVFGVRRAFWERERNFTGGHAVAYAMPRWASVDVDTLDDLEMARAIDAWRGR